MEIQNIAYAFHRMTNLKVELLLFVVLNGVVPIFSSNYKFQLNYMHNLMCMLLTQLYEKLYFVHFWL